MSETSTTTSGNWLHTSVPKEFSDRTPHFWIMESRTLLYNSVDDNDLLSGSDFSLQEWIPCVGWSPSGRVPVACFFLQWLWNVRATAPPCCTHVCISYHEPLVLEEWYHCCVLELVKSAAGAHEGKSGQESCTRDSHTCQDYFYNTYQSYLLASDACFLVTPPAVTETPVW